MTGKLLVHYKLNKFEIQIVSVELTITVFSTLDILKDCTLSDENKYNRQITVWKKLV